MSPPGKTSLARMLSTAIEEQDRIEISLRGREDPWPHMVQKRDDLAGMVRLLTIVIGDDALRGKIEDRMKAAASAEKAAQAIVVTPTPAPAPKAKEPSADDDVVYDGTTDEVEA